MDEENERDLAMHMNAIFVAKCDELWVFGVNEIKDEDVIKGFVSVAEHGLSNKNEILEKLQFIENKFNEYNDLIEHYNSELKYVNDEFFIYFVVEIVL